MMTDEITVDGDGDLALGAQWGRFQVTGKTLREAETMIQQQAQALAAKAWLVRETRETGSAPDEAPIEIAVQVTRSASKQPTIKKAAGGFGGRFGSESRGGGGFGGDFGGDAFGSRPKPKQAKR